ncbi:MAG: hypothetical protein ACE5MK_12095 [Acidobacteriota bacterium]
MLVILSFLNGIYHGLGADHLMAITALANRGGSRREVSLMGLRFGLGHMGILVLLGVAGLLWNFTASAAWESRAEMLGGGLLILLGLWTLLEWLKGVGYIHSHRHIHEHSDHTHSHLHFHFKAGHPNEHVHPHFSSLLGALFALSGLRSLLLSVFPILQARSMGWALLYILVFGTGIVISMTAYGLVAGSALSKARSRSGVTLLLSATSITLGVYWIWVS